MANSRRAIARLLEVGADLVDSDRPSVAVAARDELSRTRASAVDTEARPVSAKNEPTAEVTR